MAKLCKRMNLTPRSKPTSFTPLLKLSNSSRKRLLPSSTNLSTWPSSSASIRASPTRPSAALS